MIPMQKKTIILMALGVFVVAAALTAAIFLTRRADASAIATPAPVRVEAAAPLPLPTTVPPMAPAAPAPAAVVIARASGNLVSLNQSSLAFQTSGRIQGIKVKEDAQVKAGDVLATLDTAAEMDAQLAQAQAALDSANANLALVKAGPTQDAVLVAKGNLDHAKGALEQAQAAYDKIGGTGNSSIVATTQSLNLQQAVSAYESALGTFNLTVDHPTDAELKSAQAAVATAQATLQTAKQNAANARITAPFDGTVVWLNAQMGTSVVPGTAVATVADLSHMQVTVNADEVSGAGIKAGQPVSITVDALPSLNLSGHVSLIGLLASTSGNLVSIPVTVDIDPTDAPIYPGLSATVQFQGGNE